MHTWWLRATLSKWVLAWRFNGPRDLLPVSTGEPLRGQVHAFTRANDSSWTTCPTFIDWSRNRQRSVVAQIGATLLASSLLMNAAHADDWIQLDTNHLDPGVQLLPLATCQQAGPSGFELPGRSSRQHGVSNTRSPVREGPPRPVVLCQAGWRRGPRSLRKGFLWRRPMRRRPSW